MPTLVATVTDADFTGTSSTYGLDRVVLSLASSTLGAGSTWEVEAPGGNVVVRTNQTGHASVLYPSVSKATNIDPTAEVYVPSLPHGSQIIITVRATSGGATLAGTAQYATAAGSPTTVTGGGSPLASTNYHTGVFRGLTVPMNTPLIANYGSGLSMSNTSTPNSATLATNNYMVTRVTKAWTINSVSGWTTGQIGMYVGITEPTPEVILPAAITPSITLAYSIWNDIAANGGEPWMLGFAPKDEVGNTISFDIVPTVPFQPNNSTIGALRMLHGPSATSKTVNTTLGTTTWYVTPCTWTSVSVSAPLTPAIYAYGVQTGTPTGQSAAYGVY